MIRCLSFLAATAITTASAAATPCTGQGDSLHDWLVAGCDVAATFTHSPPRSDGSVEFLLSNGIITRALVYNDTTGILSTTAITMPANATSLNLVTTVVPEASLFINNKLVQVGGIAAQLTGAVVASFRGQWPRSSSAVAGAFLWVPGTRGSNPNAPWPPHGSRVEFDHIVPCASIDDAEAVNDDDVAEALITITIAYEQYRGTSGFVRRVIVAHNCTANINVTDISTAYLSLRNNGHVEFTSDSEASLTRPIPPLGDGTRPKTQVPYSPHGEGLIGLLPAPQQRYESYLLAEIYHASAAIDATALGGVDRYARESARFWRLVTPQIEQMIVYVQGICTGGNIKYPADGNDGTVGYWCYDEEGTDGIKRLIDETKEMEADMLVFGQNMNQSWRSMIGPEFNSAENTTWFSNLVARAHNTSGGQHAVEVGLYQLLLNARSATALNQAAPGNSYHLPGHWFDAEDPHTHLPDHNGGKTSCGKAFGPGCSSLCAGTSFYQQMKTTMLDFWRTARLSVIDQDGSRYMDCANASHAHHHGESDSMRVQFEEIKSLFHAYLEVPQAAGWEPTLPKVAFVTSASSNFLEAGQAKVPGGYNEQVWSLPRWHWIDLQRVLIISGVDAFVNVQRYYPVPLSMPYHNVQYNTADPIHWKPCYGYLTNATLTPLEEHLPELNWVLSQTFGTGIMAQLRSRYLYDGPKSKALLQKWIKWMRKYHGILSQDFVTLSLTTTCVNQTQPTMKCSLNATTGIDAIIHHGSQGIRTDFAERAMIMVWNPAPDAYVGTLTAPLYYSGLTGAAGVHTVGVSKEGGAIVRTPLEEPGNFVTLDIKLGPRELTWIVITE